jgi:tetratricopeptide (TPR) repeat protein
VASTLEVRASVSADQGDLSNALASYDQELTIVREVGDKRAESSALNNAASILDQQGDLSGAKTMYEQGLAT